MSQAKTQSSSAPSSNEKGTADAGKTGAGTTTADAGKTGAASTPNAEGESDAKARKPKPRVLSQAERDGQTIRVLTDDVRVWKEVV